MQARTAALSVTALALLVAGSALAAPKPPKHHRLAVKKVATTTTTVSTTTIHTEPAATTTAHTEPARTTTVHTEPAPSAVADARGKISSLRGDGLSVTRDNGTTASCRYEPAQAAALAASFPLGTGVKITCTLEGTGYRLATIERA